jgi:peptidoglycan/LPS O-acetylase OafA/YrhL
MASDKHRPAIALDILRGLAAFEVFLTHVRGASFVEYAALPATQHSAPVAALFGMTRLGREAVLVFFVLSGYLVFGQVIRRLAEQRFDLKSYVIDRVTRIFVPLIPACAFTAILAWAAYGSPINAKQLLLHIAGLNGILTDTFSTNAPLWTLGYEIWFYILAGALGYLIAGRLKSNAAFLVLACGAAIFSVRDAHFLLYWIMGGLVV